MVGEGSKVGEFNTSKGWFGHVRKRFGLKNEDEITEVAASTDQGAADKFPDDIEKITEKGCLPEQAFNADKSALFRGTGGKSHKGHRLVRKRSKHQA